MEIFNRGDKVRVEYSYQKFFEGTVLWTEKSGSLEFVTVRPNDLKMIYTFGSSRDMGNQYKAYIANHEILGRVTKI
jgi:hypothetical protein